MGGASEVGAREERESEWGSGMGAALSTGRDEVWAGTKRWGAWATGQEEVGAGERFKDDVTRAEARVNEVERKSDRVNESEGAREYPAVLQVPRLSYLIASVHKVVSQKSIPPQIRQLILYYY